MTFQKKVLLLPCESCLFLDSDVGADGCSAFDSFLLGPGGTGGGGPTLEGPAANVVDAEAVDVFAVAATGAGGGSCGFSLAVFGVAVEFFFPIALKTVEAMEFSPPKPNDPLESCLAADIIFLGLDAPGTELLTFSEFSGALVSSGIGVTFSFS